MRTKRTSYILLPLAATIGFCGSASAETKINSKGLTFETADGNSTLNIGGRIHYDFADFDSDLTPFIDNDDTRRARITISGKIADDWSYKIENDFGGTSQGWKNVWVNYGGIKNWDFRIGNITAPVGMEQQLGSNDIPLMERSLASALTPGFLTGGQATYGRKGFTATLGYYGDAIDADPDSTNNSGASFAGRITYAPIRSKGHVLHFGSSFEQRDIDAGSDYSLRARPGSGLTDLTLVNTGLLPNIKQSTTFGLEAGVIVGPASFLVESLSVNVKPESGSSLDFSGWHATGAWIITGETRKYNTGSGTFGGFRPENKWGALELAMRIDEIDLNDGLVSGGKQKNVSYGLNWYIGENFRLMFDHVQAKARPNQGGLNESVDINQIRAQMDF